MTPTPNPLADAFMEAGFTIRAAELHLEMAQREAAELATIITTQAASQAAHNVLCNWPRGIMPPGTEDRADEGNIERARWVALRSLVHAAGKYLRWDVDAAIELCADIMEDVNDHDLAAELRGRVGR